MILMPLNEDIISRHFPPDFMVISAHDSDDLLFSGEDRYHLVGYLIDIKESRRGI